jgi:SAM-dependent MidA family methyltransferase
MFGELVGAALADCWARAGKPTEAVYAELGPGRGTLAADALRVLRGAGFAGEVHLVETSPMLREAQAQTVPDAQWHESIDDLPDAPLLLAANEFFDALPVRQFVGGIERRVALTPAGLAFDRDGEIVEDSPVRSEAMTQVAKRLAARGGAASVIDYGHERTAPGDTLQAVRGHNFSPVLHNPGEQDLTSHVDFEALAKAACEAGAEVTPLVTQGEWLRRLGLDARASALTKSQPDRAEEIDAARARLSDADQMGQLFKVMAIHGPSWPAPVGFDA